MATARRPREINSFFVHGICLARPRYRFQYILLHQLGATGLSQVGSLVVRGVRVGIGARHASPDGQRLKRKRIRWLTFRTSGLLFGPWKSGKI